MNSPCPICGSDRAKVVAHERMFGTSDTFEYFSCLGCGCLEIAEVPANLYEYYARDYYSHRPRDRHSTSGRWRTALRRWRIRQIVRDTPLAPFASRGIRSLQTTLQAIGKVKTNGLVHLLDVGSGSGRLLRQLSYLGTFRLTGIDPFLSDTIESQPQFELRKCTIFDFEEGVDIVLFNHSLEHMRNHDQVLRHVRRVLAPNGTCIVRMPIVSPYFSGVFRLAWPQLDAPRHLFLHTLDSFSRVVHEAGFVIREVILDAQTFSLEAGALYLGGHPLVELRRANPIFTSTLGARKMTKMLNTSLLADQALFRLEVVQRDIHKEQRGSF